MRAVQPAPAFPTFVLFSRNSAIARTGAIAHLPRAPRRTTSYTARIAPSPGIHKPLPRSATLPRIASRAPRPRVTFRSSSATPARHSTRLIPVSPSPFLCTGRTSAFGCRILAFFARVRILPFPAAKATLHLYASPSLTAQPQRQTSSLGSPSQTAPPAACCRTPGWPRPSHSRRTFRPAESSPPSASLRVQT